MYILNLSWPAKLDTEYFKESAGGKKERRLLPGDIPGWKISSECVRVCV